MKKYRVTDANEVLRPGQEVIFNGPESVYCSSEGIYVHEIELQNHPTWYEEVKPEPDFISTTDPITTSCSIFEFWISYHRNDEDYYIPVTRFFKDKVQAEEALKRCKKVLQAYQEEITK